MKIGIVNAGNVGLRLAFSWIRHGHEVMISKDTHPEQLKERARDFSLHKGIAEPMTDLKYGSITDAAKFGDVVVVSVYFPRLSHILQELQNNGITLAGKIVIDTMNPLNVDANFNHYHDLEYIERTSVTKPVQEAFPEAVVFKAFNLMPATLLDVQNWESDRVPPIMFMGGKGPAIDTVRQLISDAGFKPRFAGYDLNKSGLLERMLLHLLVENEYEGNTNVLFDVMERHT